MAALYPLSRFQVRLEQQPLPIRGSPFHLQKTITNLVTNAAEAMPSGGTVTIATAACRLDAPLEGYSRISPGRYALIEISDEGIGIPAADRERIFEPFFTTKEMGHSGSGLGMAVVWGTVKDHLGHIDLESREGKGTRIGLYFPLMPDTVVASQSPAPPRAPPRGQGERILVVDDTPEQREIAAEMLQFLGYRPVAVDSGETAVAWLDTQSCDLVLLDMLMAPGIDGLETYRRFVAVHPGLKVVIATGFSETARRQEAERLGVNAFLAKPYNLSLLATTLQDVLRD